MNQPLYQKITQALKKQIALGIFPTDSKLPTEKELATLYQVSRITSKRALTDLEHAGIIYRIRGKGSFVKHDHIQITPSVKPHKKRILFLLPFANDLSLGNFTEELLPLLYQQKFDLFLTSTEFIQQKQSDEIIEEFDGLIYYSSHLEAHLDFLFDLSLQHFPTVLLDQKLHELPFPSIVSDNFSGGKQACHYLIEQGHTQIGYIFGHSTHAQTARQRYLGYLEQIKKEKLPFYTIYADREASVTSLISYIEKNQLTALICENDVTAISAIQLLTAQGWNIPDQLSIIGFDNIQASHFIEPSLTTIAQNFKEIGKKAGEILLNWIKTQKQPADIKLDVKLIKRQSVAQLVDKKQTKSSIS